MAGTANLQNTKLENADLQGALLINVDLQGTLLINVDLQEALLIDVNLQKVNLNKVKLQKARSTDKNTSFKTCNNYFVNYPCPTTFPPKFNPKAAGMVLVK